MSFPIIANYNFELADLNPMIFKMKDLRGNKKFIFMELYSFQKNGVD